MLAAGCLGHCWCHLHHAAPYGQEDGQAEAGVFLTWAVDRFSGAAFSLCMELRDAAPMGVRMLAGLLPQRQDLWRVMGLGLCLYFNQLFYIIGIDMSGVVVATCMQPTIPVFTAMIAVMLNLEAGSLQKFVGIVLAVGGSICMVSPADLIPLLSYRGPPREAGAAFCTPVMSGSSCTVGAASCCVMR